MPAGAMPAAPTARSAASCVLEVGEGVVLLRGIEVPVDIDHTRNRAIRIEALHDAVHEAQQDAAARVHVRRMRYAAPLHHVVTGEDLAVLIAKPAFDDVSIGGTEVLVDPRPRLVVDL